MVIAAFLIRYLLHRVHGSFLPVELLAADAIAYAAIFVAVAMHRQRLGAWLVGGGGALNVIAMMTHGGRMPVWLAATARLTPATVARIVAGHLPSYAAMASARGTGWLGDVIALPRPLPAQVLSVGDLVLIVGIIVFLSTAMVAPQR